MAETIQPAAFDVRTTDHEQIKDWIETHDGYPVVVQEAVDHEVDVEFGDVDDPVEMPADWTTFFDRFDTTDQMFAYQTEPDGAPEDAYAFFDRTRIEASNRLDGEGADSDHQVEPDLPDEHVGDGRSEIRHEEATDQENADNHRDEPPFNA